MIGCYYDYVELLKNGYDRFVWNTLSCILWRNASSHMTQHEAHIFNTCTCTGDTAILSFLYPVLAGVRLCPSPSQNKPKKPCGLTTILLPKCLQTTLVCGLAWCSSRRSRPAWASPPSNSIDFNDELKTIGWPIVVKLISSSILLSGYCKYYLLTTPRPTRASWLCARSSEFAIVMAPVSVMRYRMCRGSPSQPRSFS